jgi:hypothetical protein
MIISLALASLAIASGTIASYLYDSDVPIAARLCEGACVGLAVLGLVGFVCASLLGLTVVSVVLTATVLAASLLLLLDNTRRRALQADLSDAAYGIRCFFHRPTRGALGYIVFYAITAILFWRIFERAVIFTPEGISTGLLNNFGDLPFHLSVITGFAFGNNFPPQDPTYAGVSFTYPFMTDFVSAIFVRCGADLRESMFIENLVLALAFVGLLHRWAYVMLRNSLAAVLTPLIVLLNGGFGWTLLWQYGKNNDQGLFGVFQNLPPSFTIIPDTIWRWGNAISTLLVPQRGMLLGLPIAVIVFTQWWLATSAEERGSGEPERRRNGDGENRGNGEADKDGSGEGEIERREGRANKVGQKTKKRGKSGKYLRAPGSAHPRIAASPTRRVVTSSRRRGTASPTRPLLSIAPWQRMAAAGVVAGLLPLVHAHSFVAVMAVGFFIGLLHRRWRDWLVFFVAASVVALPQMWWSTHHSAVNATKFFEWKFGWDRGNEDAVWFWFKNTGLFIPLIVTAILWRGKNYLISSRVLMFYLPFTLCFIVPNVLKMAPWIWDNIKVLFYWWLASAPLVAMLLARLWRRGPAARILSVLLFCCVTFAGALDVAGIAFRSIQYEVFDANGVRFAELVKQKTEPQALIVHAPVHNHPVFLTGRRSLMGYPGHIWTHGLEYTQREGEIRRIYAGAPDALSLMAKHRLQYAVIGPQERNGLRANEQFFSRFPVIGEVGEYRLFKINP